MPRRIHSQHLPNAHRLNAKVISGGQPDGESAFAELKKLGVKTVISVDGARPEVALARKYGLRYVHLPHGYDGIPDARAMDLAKAVRDLPGPIYIHCHHGKHRSPAAAVVACVAVGMLEPRQAVDFLRLAGTSEKHRGLYESAERAQRLESSLLDALDADFPESAQLPPLAESMVAIEHVHDHLTILAKAGWRPTADHPDLKPAHEALLLREHFTELLRTEAVMAQPDEFRRMIHDSAAAARELETVLEAGDQGRSWMPRAQAAFERITAHCTTCHTRFRDVPLSEKQP